MPAAIETFAQKLHGLIHKIEADKARRNRMVALVERMLKLNKRKHDVAPTLRSASDRRLSICSASPPA